jgi:hypothetical protein
MKRVVALLVGSASLVAAASLMLAPRNAAASDNSFALSVNVPAAKKGQRAVVRVHIAPGSGYHMNKDFPTALVLTAPEGVAVEKLRQNAKDAVKLEEAGADFDVALTASAVGKQVVTGDLKFAVCTATSCDPKREKLSFTVDVK